MGCPAGAGALMVWQKRCKKIVEIIVGADGLKPQPTVDESAALTIEL